MPSHGLARCGAPYFPPIRKLLSIAVCSKLERPPMPRTFTAQSLHSSRPPILYIPDVPRLPPLWHPADSPWQAPASWMSSFDMGCCVGSCELVRPSTASDGRWPALQAVSSRELSGDGAQVSRVQSLAAVKLECVPQGLFRLLWGSSEVRSAWGRRWSQGMIDGRPRRCRNTEGPELGPGKQDLLSSSGLSWGALSAARHPEVLATSARMTA